MSTTIQPTICPVMMDLSGKKLAVHLLRHPRKTLGITVKPDGSVWVTAPVEASQEAVSAILTKRRRWIAKQQAGFAKLPTKVALRRYVSGETYRYLGRQYRLKVEVGKNPNIKLSGAFFRVAVLDSKNTPAVAKLLHDWFSTHARQVFATRLERLIKSTPLLELKTTPPLLVRKIKTRWGSCSPSGRILMNLDTIQLPVTCIDYVLMHELCHLRYPNHGKAFWRLLDRCMPDWKVRREKLAKIGVE